MSTRWRSASAAARGMALLCLAVAVASPSEAAGLRSSVFLTYGTRGEEKIDVDAPRLEKISVFAYHITADGDVLPPDPWVPEMLDRLMASPRGHTILVTVNNRVLGPDGRPAPFHSGDTVQAILADPAKRAEHIRQLVALSRHADGLELNYENLPPESRSYFTDFVRDLRGAMPKERKLSIVLQPKTTNASGSRGRAVDWRAIEPYADYLRVMAYYYSFSTSPPGPVVPKDTLRALADYALHDAEQSIPRSKVSVILSFWGWDWPLAGTDKGRLIEFDEAMQLASTYGVTPERDPTEESLHFRYTAADGTPHEVWIDDATSLRARIELLQGAGMPRVDFWNLNTGDPDAWAYVRAHAVRPPAPMDFDGDGKTDVAVFRPSTGQWFFDGSHDGKPDARAQLGQPGDVPVPADYDGNGTTDVAVFRPSTGHWLIDLDHDGTPELDVPFGTSDDVPVPGDYDGDGQADLAVDRPSTGQWVVDRDRDGIADVIAGSGEPGDIAVPADFDGDGVTDFAVFRPSSTHWRIDTDRDGVVDLDRAYGRAGDVPVPADYDGDGLADLAVFRPSSGRWYFDGSRDGRSDLALDYGQNGDIPVPGDYDGNGRTDIAVFRRNGRGWFVDGSRDGGSDLQVRFGESSDTPLRANGAVLDAQAP